MPLGHNQVVLPILEDIAYKCIDALHDTLIHAFLKTMMINLEKLMININLPSRDQDTI